MESLHSEYDRQKFELNTGVSLFSRYKTIACIRDGSELTVCVWLQECSSNTSHHTAGMPVYEDHSSVTMSCLILLS